MNKFLKILSYIFIGIVLLPIALILLYVGLGASLYIFLFIKDRIKNGRVDPRDGKGYRTISTILILLGLISVIYVGQLSFISIEGYLWINGITFIGLLPMCYHAYLRLKNKV